MVMASSLAPAQKPSPDAEALFRWVEKELMARRGECDLHRQYYAGHHRTLLTDRLKAFLPRDLQGQFRDNYCGIVVNAPLNRLNVVGFTGDNAPLAEWAWQLWQQQRMDAIQGQAHLDALVTGDGYILVDWDSETQSPRLTPQKTEMIWPHYNETTRRIDWASKKWTQEGERIGDPPVTRLNIYYPERVEKYLARNNVWLRFQEPGDAGWPLPWVDAQGQPLGVMLAHFRNDDQGEDFGYSELCNVVPLQDLLNKTLIDLIQVMDTMAFPQRWTMDITSGGGDANGKRASTFDIVPGTISQFFSETEGGQVGEWPAAPVDGLLRSLEIMVQHIASISSTPQHLFQIGGGVPSGEALKTSESGLVQKVKRKQVVFGNAWEDAMMMAAKLQSVFGEGFALPEGARLETTWADPETRNEEAFLLGLGVKRNQLGVPRRQIWREAGYSEEEIKQMEADFAAERTAEANIGAELLRQFDQGQQGKEEV